MSYRSERFNNAMHSLDMKTAAKDLSKMSFFSDEGRGAKLIYTQLDQTPETIQEEEDRYWQEREQKIKNAIVALIAAGYGYTAPTLLMIIENENNREETIWQMLNQGL